MWTFCVYFFIYLHFLVANTIQTVPEESGPDMKGYLSVASCIIEVGKTKLFWNPTVVIKIPDNQSTNKTNFANFIINKLTENYVPYFTADQFEGDMQASYLLVEYFEDCNALTEFNFESIHVKVKYLLIIENYVPEVCKENFHDTGTIIGRYDVSFFIKITEIQYNMYTFIPVFNGATCEEVVGAPQMINTCLLGRLLTRDVFPHKNPTNMNQCPLKVSLGRLYPLSVIEGNSSLANYDPLDMEKVRGLDIEIIKIIVVYFNATLDLRYVFKLEENAFLNMEFIDYLLNGSLDMCAGGMYRIYGDKVEYSGVYVRQSIMWVYHVERLPTTWQSLVATIDGLYLFIIFYVSYTAIWYLIRKFDKHVVSMKDTLLYGWGALVGTSSLQDARSLKQKILNIVYLNMCLHLSVYINIQLYSFLTIRGPPQLLKTNEDIMESGRIPYLNSLTKYFMADEKYIRFANTSYDCASFIDCARQTLVYKSMTVVMLGFYYNYQAQTAVNDEARVLRTLESLLTVYNEMLIRKDSPLVAKFQKAIERLFEAGISQKLFEQAIGLTVVGRSKIATANMVTNSYTCQAGCKISLEQFYGVFYVWAIGCAVSFSVFVIEVLFERRL